ncbi:MAG: 50S ribosomal protein L17 [Elusimicrobiota bacterium]|jgi:large subunit ribosomal protein L17|nr:50S ribosomal protein L17 [Elusimicrobiota bacterium]
MIKTYNGSKLGITPSHKRSLLRNMSAQLFLYEKIVTTLPKAKELRSFSERLITKAKKNDLNAKKALHSQINDKEIVKKVFEVLVPRYSARNGGYTRIIKVGKRRGDAADTAIVQLIV